MEFDDEQRDPHHSEDGKAEPLETYINITFYNVDYIPTINTIIIIIILIIMITRQSDLLPAGVSSFAASSPLPLSPVDQPYQLSVFLYLLHDDDGDHESDDDDNGDDG